MEPMETQERQSLISQGTTQIKLFKTLLNVYMIMSVVQAFLH